MSARRLSDAEVLVQLARESMERFGTALPPGFGGLPTKEKVEEPAATRRRRRATASDKTPSSDDTDWRTVISRCGNKNCTHGRGGNSYEGPVEPDFGVRVVRGVVRKQSWCKRCRAETQYAQKPRKNFSKHNPRR